MITNGASGGNKYDGSGNLYLRLQSVLVLMSPGGMFTKLADAPLTTTCFQQTPTTVKFTSSGFGEFAFNQAINSLYIVTEHSEVVYSIASGSCNPDGTFAGTVSNGVSTGTSALIRVEGFKQFLHK